MYTTSDMDYIFDYTTKNLYHDIYYMVKEDNPGLNDFSLEFSQRETSLILNLYGCIDNA